MAYDLEKLIGKDINELWVSNVDDAFLIRCDNGALLKIIIRPALGETNWEGKYKLIDKDQS